MSRTMTLMLAIAAAVSIVAPAQAADLVPRLLAPSVRTLEPADGARCATTTYRSAVTGMLDVRLRGSGDWDLAVRDADRRRVASSRGFGGNEVVQGDDVCCPAKIVERTYAWSDGSKTLRQRGSRERPGPTA